MRIYILTLAFLGICSFQDVRKHEISKKLLAAGGIAAGLIQICTGRLPYGSFVGGIAAGLVLLGIAFVTREALGYGDGWAVVVLGMLVGFLEIVEILLLAFFMAAFVSGGLLALKKAGRKYTLPFLPFLTAAAGICIVLEEIA